MGLCCDGMAVLTWVLAVSWGPVCGRRVRVGGAGEKWSVAVRGRLVRRLCVCVHVSVRGCAAVAPEGGMRSGP